jgi:hypothetical protein
VNEKAVMRFCVFKCKVAFEPFGAGGVSPKDAPPASLALHPAGALLFQA